MSEVLLVALIGGHFTVLAALIQRSSKRRSHEVDKFTGLVSRLDQRLEDHIACHDCVKGDQQ